MSDRERASVEELAGRIVAALMDAGVLDARFEEEAIRVVVAQLVADRRAEF